jgi:hypothetical protein
MPRIASRRKNWHFAAAFHSVRKERAMTRATISTLLGFACLLAVAAPASAQTRTCQSEIDRLQTLISNAESGGAPVTDMKEGTFATLHRQPSASSVLAADKDAMAKAKTALDTAQKLHKQGKDAECLKAMDDIAF